MRAHCMLLAAKRWEIIVITSSSISCVIMRIIFINSSLSSHYILRHCSSCCVIIIIIFWASLRIIASLHLRFLFCIFWLLLFAIWLLLFPIWLLFFPLCASCDIGQGWQGGGKQGCFHEEKEQGQDFIRPEGSSSCEEGGERQCGQGLLSPTRRKTRTRPDAEEEGKVVEVPVRKSYMLIALLFRILHRKTKKSCENRVCLSLKS